MFAKYSHVFSSSLTHYLRDLLMTDKANTTSSLTATNTRQFSTPRQAKQVVYLGLSLTLIMAAALFVMVFMNPKSAEYSFLPLVYAGLSLIGSIVFNRLQRDPIHLARRAHKRCSQRATSLYTQLVRQSRATEALHFSLTKSSYAAIYLVHERRFSEWVVGSSGRCKASSFVGSAPRFRLA